MVDEAGECVVPTGVGGCWAEHAVSGVDAGGVSGVQGSPFVRAAGLAGWH